MGTRNVIRSSNQLAPCLDAAAAGDVSEDALAACTRLAESRDLTPADRANVLINRGVMHMTRREFPAALADFDAAAALSPRNGEARVNRGAALIQNGQPGPAVASITEALLLGVHEPYKAYYNRGVAREQLGDVRGAYEDYSTALSIQPDWGPAQADLARFVRTRRERLASALGEAAPADPAATAAH